MDRITWSDTFSVGVAELDDQHKRLVRMINRLIDEQKTLTKPETIAELITEMTDYTLEHFRAEEYLMAEYGYERLAQHVEVHQDFIKKTQGFMAVPAGPNLLSKALLEFLKSWLVGHILHEDMQYKTLFQLKGVS